MHRDAYEGGGRTARRRPNRSEDRDWYVPDNNVWAYSLPHRPPVTEVQRPDDRTPRGYGRAPRNSRSLDAFQNNMPPPHLMRASTDAYRRPKDIPVYEDDDEDEDEEEEEPVDHWRRPRTREPSPEYERPRPRLIRREPQSARRHLKPQHQQPSPSESTTSESESETETESETESESESDDEIEVVELDDDEEEESDEEDEDDELQHHRQPRGYLSRDAHIDASQDRRLRERSRRRRASISGDEVDPHYHNEPEIVSPVRRIQARHHDGEAAMHDRQSRVISVIDNTRPPVASRRAMKIYETREAHHREGRRRAVSAHTTPHQSRSSSRRPPSLLGSLFSSSSRMSSPERPPKLRDCIVCLSEVPASKCPKMRCGHRMCHACLKRSFKLSIKDPQHMPPKCCNAPIQLHHVDRLFDRSFKKQWNHKFAEYSTRNRVYCPARRCGEWIKPANIHHDRVSGRKIGQCGQCKTKVCVSCNSKWHYPNRCRRDEETARFLEHAKEEGWQRCYKCKYMVELQEGCNHMTCRCGAQFCMICGSKWKSCECPWFSYDFEPDHPDDMTAPSPRSRREIEHAIDDDEPSSPRSRPARHGLPSTRSRSQSFGAEIAEITPPRLKIRKSQYLSEGEHDKGHDPRGLVSVRTGPKSAFMRNPYEHKMSVPRAPASLAPPRVSRDARSHFERGPASDFVANSRGISINQRLGGRYFDGRPSLGAMPEMEPPPMGHHHMGPPMMMPPMMGPQLMGPQMMGPQMMGPQLMMPPMGMPPPVQDGGYPGGRVIVEHDPNSYDDDGRSYISHGSQNRKRGGGKSKKSKKHIRQKEERRKGEPKSSVLAGLGGRGQGMGRVDVWREYVEPGDFDGEIAAGAIVTV